MPISKKLFPSSPSRLTTIKPPELGGQERDSSVVLTSRALEVVLLLSRMCRFFTTAVRLVVGSDFEEASLLANSVLPFAASLTATKATASRKRIVLQFDLVAEQQHSAFLETGTAAGAGVGAVKTTGAAAADTVVVVVAGGGWGRRCMFPAVENLMMAGGEGRYSGEQLKIYLLFRAHGDSVSHHQACCRRRSLLLPSSSAAALSRCWLSVACSGRLLAGCRSSASLIAFSLLHEGLCY